MEVRSQTFSDLCKVGEVVVEGGVAGGGSGGMIGASEEFVVATGDVSPPTPEILVVLCDSITGRARATCSGDPTVTRRRPGGFQQQGRKERKRKKEEGVHSNLEKRSSSLLSGEF